MKLVRIVRGVRNRWRTLLRYAGAAPRMTALPKWLFLGAVRARLLGGHACHGFSTGGQCCDLHIPIGRDRGEQVLVDTTSFAELNVFEEVLVDRIYPLHRIGFVPAMILDCGANIGYFASLCRLYFPKAEIVCWEPDPHNFSRLTRQPMLQCGMVHSYQVAVSNVEGDAFLTGSGAGCTLVDLPGDGGQRIKTVNLTRWIVENGKVPMLIKMDIEGHEVAVIGALNGVWKGPCVLFLETHAEAGRDEHVTTQLTMSGFNLTLLRSHELPEDQRIFKEYLCTLGLA